MTYIKLLVSIIITVIIGSIIIDLVLNTFGLNSFIKSLFDYLLANNSLLLIIAILIYSVVVLIVCIVSGPLGLSPLKSKAFQEFTKDGSYTNLFYSSTIAIMFSALGFTLFIS